MLGGVLAFLITLLAVRFAHDAPTEGIAKLGRDAVRLEARIRELDDSVALLRCREGQIERSVNALARYYDAVQRLQQPSDFDTPSPASTRTAIEVSARIPPAPADADDELIVIDDGESALFARLAALNPTSDWRKFEFLVAEIFRHLGYCPKVTPPSNDDGVDVVVRRPDRSAQIAVQANCTRRALGYGKTKCSNSTAGRAVMAAATAPSSRRAV